jgi:DHA2 family multidrug resistance protein-like MFS transporter
VLSVIYGLKRIAEDGRPVAARRLPSWWASPSVVAFVRRQLARADPFIDLRLFRSAAFSGSLVVYMIGTFVAFGSTSSSPSTCSSCSGCRR